MTVQEALQEGNRLLTLAQVDTPFLDAALLLGHTLGLTKEDLFAAFSETLPECDWHKYRTILKRRAEGIPISYIRNKKEFYGLEFYVDERVLVPRPDSETLIEEARRLIQERNGIRRILDLGTGSGCLAVTMKYLYPNLYLLGSDISEDAIKVAQKNSRAITGVSIPLIKSDLFESLEGIFDLIISNPPYIEDEKVEGMRTIGWPEPALALAGGPDGTAILARIIREAPAFLDTGGVLLLEADPGQMKKLEHEMGGCGYINISIRCDLAGRDRVIWGMKPA